jgi:site-specific recombinase XerD
MDETKHANNQDDSNVKVGEFVSIFNRNGKWYVNYQHDGRQVRRSLKTRSKKEARRRALMIEKEILAGEHKHAKRAPLIKHVIEQYLDHLRSEGRAEKTIGKYKFGLDLLVEIAERRHAKRLSQLNLAIVDQFRAERAAGGDKRDPAGPKTIHHDTVTIRQVVNFALRRGLIHDDPLNGLRIPKPKRTPQPFWMPDEVDSILTAARSPYRELFVFLWETGARIGEAKWLTWADIDSKGRWVHIRAKKGWAPKTGNERVVPMTDSLEELFTSMARPSDWVFTARPTSRHPTPGRQISERRALQYLKRILKALGLRGHLHTFRHSFISFAAYEGVSERVLREWIGHVDRKTLEFYFHLADSESQAARKRLSQAAARRSKKT